MSDSEPFAPPSGAMAAGRPGNVHGVPTASSWSPPPPAAPAGLAAAVIALAGAWTGLQVLLMVLSFSAAEQFSRAEAIGVDLIEVFTAYDALGGLFLPIQIASFVVTCLWLQRSRAFAQHADPSSGHVRGPVWVWLGWVVPIVSFWFPFQVVRDIRRGATGVERGGLGLWWASWLAAVLLANQSALTAMGVGSRDPAMLPAVEVLATVATVGAFAWWVRIVQEITSAQRASVSRSA